VQWQATVPAVPVAFQRAEYPVCSQCGKRHDGVCFRASGRCFSCVEVGHKMRECPKSRFQEAAADRSSRPARISTVTTEVTRATDNITKGTILIIGFRARVLFNYVVANSFISVSFVEFCVTRCWGGLVQRGFVKHCF